MNDGLDANVARVHLSSLANEPYPSVDPPLMRISQTLSIIVPNVQSRNVHMCE